MGAISLLLHSKQRHAALLMRLLLLQLASWSEHSLAMPRQRVHYNTLLVSFSITLLGKLSMGVRRESCGAFLPAIKTHVNAECAHRAQVKVQ